MDIIRVGRARKEKLRTKVRIWKHALEIESDILNNTIVVLGELEHIYVEEDLSGLVEAERVYRQKMLRRCRLIMNEELVNCLQ